MPRERPQPPPFEPEWLDRSLNRYLAWGLVFMILLLAGFVAYRVREPGLRRAATRAQTTSYTAIGTQIFAANCAQCHGKDGHADTKMGTKLNAKDLTDPKVQADFTDAKATQSIKEGVKENGKTTMKSFGGKLTDDEIKALVAYVRTLKK